MDRQIKIILLLLLQVSVFTSCEDIDLSGMFLPGETVNQRFRQSMGWNAAHPFREIHVESERYHVLSMGDSHVGGTHNLGQFLNAAQTTGAAAVVMTGDLTTGNADDYETFARCLPAVDSVQMFFVTGNHDLFFDGWSQFYTRFGSSSYLFTVSTPSAVDLFICLDSGSGTLGEEQLDWLEEVLVTSRENYRFCTIFTHNNFFRNRHTGSTNPLNEELLFLMELFTIHRVGLVITAHDHKRHAERFGNTTYITMDALMDGLDYAGYLHLAVSDGGIEYRFETFIP
jgi:predicted phosphodiesterase